MNPYKYNINFRLEKRADAQGDFPINADITFGGKRIFYFTGCKITENQWNKEGQQVRRNNFNAAGVSASDINNRLVKIRAAVEEVFSKLAHEEVAPTPKSVREALRKELDEEKTSRLTVGEYYQMLIDERFDELKRSPETARWTRPTVTKHRTILRRLSDFRKTLYFEDITVELLEKFEAFLIGQDLTNAYATQLMKSLKSFFNWASKKGYNRNFAYNNYSPVFRSANQKIEDANQFSLTDEELDAIRTFQTPSKAIDRTRNLFLFCCYSGLRFGDASNLRWRNIINGKIDIVAEKTKQHLSIPLNGLLKNILGKYGPGESPDDYVFPHISNQKFNEQMKTVGQLAGLTGDWKLIRQVGNKVTETIVPKYTVLASHAGRRTFSTRAVALGLDSQAIRAITGHTTDKMLDKYVKLGKDAKQGLMDKLDDSSTIEETEKEPATVYDFAHTKNDEIMLQRMLGIPEKERYLKQIDEDPVLAVIHIAVFLWNEQGATAAAKYIDRLPKTRQPEFYDLMVKTQAWKR